MNKRIYLFLCLALLFFLSLPVSSSDIFPYEYKIEELDNGLKIVSIPLPENPHIISYYTVVRSGSRNEVEPGKSGFAHFFEHMMFKGTKTVPREVYDDFLTELGAGTNGYTTDDSTFYFVVFAGRENLEKVVRTEADRFMNLYYDEEMLKTEAQVIEGEYYASVSSPFRRLYELMRDTAFEKHSYKHTVLGYLEDILDMPNQFEYSQLYKKRFYAPDNIILLVVGDYDHTQLMDYVRKYYSSWERSEYTLVTPVEPPQTKAKTAHYDWPSRTLPRLAIGYHGPSYSDEDKDLAALDLLAQIAFSQSSPLVQKLVIDEQKCLNIYASFPDRRDPYLISFFATLRKEEDMDTIRDEIFTELERMKTELVSESLLTEIKSNIKYSFANSLATTDGIAGSLVHYINLTTDPGTINKLFQLYETITPQDIQDMAKKYFRNENSTVVTLKGGDSQ